MSDGTFYHFCPAMGLNFLETNYFHQHLEDSSGKKLAFEGNDDYRGNSKEKLHAMELHQDYMSAVINGILFVEVEWSFAGSSDAD